MRLSTLFVIAALAAGPAQAQPSVTVTQAWSRATTPAATTGAVYVTVTVAEPDRLTGASTSASERAEIHLSRMTDGVMEMRPVMDGLPVTATAPIHMAPGGYHIMLLGLKHPLREGEHIAVTLTFDHAGAITTDAVVAGPGASQPPMIHAPQ